MTDYYSPDVIISVGYRVKSKRGVEFRRWANSVLKDYILKGYPFADGCKRIAASLFLEFLNKNNALFRDGKKVISDGALVALTLMIAESRPDEKDIMTMLVMNIISLNQAPLFSDLRKAEERAAREGWTDADDLEKELGCEEVGKTN